MALANESPSGPMGQNQLLTFDLELTALARETADFETNFSRANKLRAKDEFAQAIAVYSSLLEQSSDNRQVQIELALTHAYAENYVESIQLYRILLEATPDNVDLLEQLASVYSWKGDYAAALRQYNAILELEPNNIQTLLKKAEVLEWMGEPEDAIAIYNSVLKLEPGNVEARLDLAQIYQSQQEIRQAIQILEPLLDEGNLEAQRIVEEIRASQVDIDFLLADKGSGENVTALDTVSTFRINDSAVRQVVQAGYSEFQRSGFESVSNTYIGVGVEGQIDQINIRGDFGIDTFNRLPATPFFNVDVSVPVSPSAVFSTDLRYSTFKNNVETLENQITAMRVEPSLYWDINEDTWLFLLYGLGIYNDGNLEQKLLANIEHQIGNFFVSGLIFYWGYQDDFENGYFSPSNYSLYGAEIGWEDNISQSMRCRISAALESQSYPGESGLANTYQGECTVSFSPDVQLDVGYQYSTNAVFGEGDSSGSHQIRSGLTLVF